MFVNLTTLAPTMSQEPTSLLISVIIPCYNHAQFLSQAIESVGSQSYTHKEVIVVNDGSTDSTVDVASSYPYVQLINQNNQGMCAARNKGLMQAKGSYVVFLDSDDALLPNALETQVKYFRQNPELAFVSGGHFTANGQMQNRQSVAADVQDHHYEALLSRNYIGMLAAVMFRKNIADQYQFDTTLSGCEDYDLYLRISAGHQVLSHTEAVAVYRMVDDSKSGNMPMMLIQALKVLDRQKENIHTKKQRVAFNAGIGNWINLYCYGMYKHLVNRYRVDDRRQKEYLKALLKYKTRLFVRYYLHLIVPSLKTY